MPNISEVARLAGVSTATVSNHLNGVRVREDNAKAIDAAVRELNYHPNDFARGLRTNKSMTVGVILPELDNLFFTSIISSVDEVLDAAGYSTLVCICHSDTEREGRKLDFLRRKKIDGLIAVPCSAASDFVRDLDGLPVVLIDRMSAIGSCCCVMSDNVSAAYGAAESLISAGHKKIGLLLGPDSNYTPIERRSGFLAACVAHNVEPRGEYIRSGSYHIESGYRMTRELLELPEPLTAIFATNKELTIGALNALSELGLTPGRDLAFIGFDGELVARAVNQPLTVVVQRVDEIGRAAADTLLSLISGEIMQNKVIRIPTELRLGESVCRAKY